MWWDKTIEHNGVPKIIKFTKLIVNEQVGMGWDGATEASMQLEMIDKKNTRSQSLAVIYMQHLDTCKFLLLRRDAY